MCGRVCVFFPPLRSSQRSGDIVLVSPDGRIPNVTLSRQGPSRRFLPGRPRRFFCAVWFMGAAFPPPFPPPAAKLAHNAYLLLHSLILLFVCLVRCLLPYHALWAKLSLFCFPRWLRGVVAPVLAWLLGDRLRHWLHVRRGDRVKRRAISRWRFPRRVFLWLRRSCEPAMSSADERAGSCMPVRLGSVVRRKICVTSSGNIVGSWWS